MIDIVHEIESAQRDVGEGSVPAGVGRAVTLRRDYDAPIDDVWDAVTNPERIGRWFLPISGDYRVGGRYQLEGNAGGQILECNRPNQLKVTWVYGPVTSDADISEVVVRLTSVDAGTTRLLLQHTAVVPEDRWAEYGPGAVGVGWDQCVLGLGLYLSGSADLPERDAIEAWQTSDVGREFARRSSERWAEASIAAGTVPADAQAAAARTTDFFTGEPAA